MTCFRFNLETEDEDGKQEKKIPIFLEQNFTQFGQKLWDSRTDLKTTLIDDLKAMGPSAIGKYIYICTELEIKTFGLVSRI